VVLIPTAYAGYIGAPYAPTRRRAITKAFELLDIGVGDFVVDLGAGDGKVLLVANERGAQGLGYELSPILWAVAFVRLLGKRRLKLLWRNFFKATLPEETTHVFMFLMPEHMGQLHVFLTKQHLPQLKFVLSYSFPIPDVPALQVVQTDRAGRIFVYSAGDFAEIPGGS